MDSNHRTPKRADLQSAAVGHLATCPIAEPLVGIEPTTFPIQSGCSTSIPKLAEPLVGIEPTTFPVQSGCSTSIPKLAEPLVGIEPTTY